MTYLFRAALLTLVIFTAPAAFASQTTTTLNIEAGRSLMLFGNFHPAQTLLLGSYRQSFPYFYQEADLGGWTGTRRSGLVAYSFGGRYKDFSIGPGVGYLTTKSRALGTNWQFMLTMKYQVTEHFYGAIRHVSNGAQLFGHNHYPNRGENFITAGYTF